MVKRLLTILMLGSLAMSTYAQQLSNSTFDATWVNCYPWEAGEFVDTERGTQPEGWCISNVSQTALPIVGEEVRPGANGTGKAVKLMNVAASIGSNNAPGYITLGTAWATAETRMTSVRNADGGVFGGIPFTYHPDAVRLTYKCNRDKGEENMSVIAYLWKGTWTQKNVPSNTSIGVFSWGSATKVEMTDRINNILGKDCLTGGVETNGVRDWQISKSDDAELIASVEYYRNTKVNNWTTQEFPLNYNSSSTPEKLNIVIASNGLFDDRSTIKSDNYVIIDDVELVYWHALSALSYQGATLNFSENTTTYDLSSVVYDETKLSYTVKGQAATATKSYDEETRMLTIRVEGEDFDLEKKPSAFTEYTIQFGEPGEPDPEVVSTKTYSEDLYVTVAGETSDKQVATVVVETLDNGNINFVLKNFVLGSGEDAMPVGNIAVNDIPVDEDGSFSFDQGITIADGDDPAYAEEWIGETITMMCGGSVPLDMAGQFIGDDHVAVYISIDLTNLSFFGYPVEVHLGYARATMAVNAEAQYGTFCAPFAVAIPTGVTASKVTAVDSNGLLTLTDLSGTIPANTPVVLYAASGYTSEEMFGLAEEGTPKAGKLTGVYEDTEITSGYVLQNQSGEVGFYRVDSKITVPANRCYLTALAGSVKALSFPDGTQTSISAIQANDEKAVMYDLSGRRVSKATKGIYITNGKKVLVK